jgi:hypothetical protein
MMLLGVSTIDWQPRQHFRLYSFMREPLLRAMNPQAVMLDLV